MGMTTSTQTPGPLDETIAQIRLLLADRVARGEDLRTVPDAVADHLDGQLAERGVSMDKRQALRSLVLHTAAEWYISLLPSNAAARVIAQAQR